MDRETRHELDRLFGCFRDALTDVRFASSDEELLAAWRKVQTTGWELNAVIGSPPTHELSGHQT